MSWFTRLFRKSDRPQYLFSYQRPGQPVSWPRSYDSFAKEGYQKNVVAFRCISMIATACAGIPLVCYSKKGRNRKEEIEDHPVLTLLDRPNPKQYGPSFMESMIAFREIAGNSYILAVGSPNPKRPPTELWPLNPQIVKVIPGSKGMPEAFRYGQFDSYVDYPVDPFSGVSDVLQMKNFHPTDPWYGMSPIEAAAFSIDQHNESGKWNAALLQNSAQPSGALVMQVTDNNPQGKIGQEQYLRLKEDIAERFSGSRNAGRPMLLEGGLDWKQLSLTPKDMDFVNSKSTSARDICFAFGVPGMLVGIPGDNTYANYKEARLAFYEEKILPLLDITMADLNGFLMPRYGGNLELAYDKDEIEALSPKREAVWDRVNKATDLTINEKRHARGYEELDPEDGGDIILVPTSSTSLEAIAKDAMADPEDEELNDSGSTGSANLDDDDDEAEGGNDSDPAAQEADADTGKAYKVFNLSSRNAKQREVKRQNRLRIKYINRTKSQVSALFKVEGSQVAHAIEGMSEQQAIIAATHAISAYSKNWKPVLKRAIKSCAMDFGGKVLEQAKDMKGFMGRKDAQSKFDSSLDYWIENHVGERIQDLEETTRKRVIKAIRDAYAESLANGDVQSVNFSQKIEDIYDGFSEGRAKNIARTEMGTASNYASYKAAQATGLDLTKEWVSLLLPTTRDDHRDAHGQVIGMDEKFQVGDYEMTSPGDPSAGPEEICNCYCILVYSGKGSEDNEE